MPPASAIVARKSRSSYTIVEIRRHPRARGTGFSRSHIMPDAKGASARARIKGKKVALYPFQVCGTRAREGEG